MTFFAKALVLSDGETEAAILTADLLLGTTDDMRDIVRALEKIKRHADELAP